MWVKVDDFLIINLKEVYSFMTMNIPIWCGDIDDELTAKGYIVPGLGDAGDLAYGTKMQS